MTGPWPNPKNGILYYRKATPADIWAERGRLGELGVTVTREVQRSLDTRERKEAARLYAGVSAEVEAQWQRWRDLLANGPQALTHRQEVALAAEHGRAFLAAHEDDPFSTPAPDAAPAIPEDNGAWDAVVDAMVPEVRKAFARDLRELERAGKDRQVALSLRLLQKYPQLVPVLGSAVVAQHGPDADVAVARKGLKVTQRSRRNVAVEMMLMEGAARRGLERRKAGDYGPVPELSNAPAFEPASKPAGGEGKGLSLFHLLEEKDRVKGREDRHTRKDRGLLAKFVEFIGHDDARRITKADVRRWRDAMVAEGLDPKTINDRRLALVRSVLNHGIKEFDLPGNVAEGVVDGRKSAVRGRKEYTAKEALTILHGTLSVPPKLGLSLPHKRAVFWVPWVLAYTGLRVTEVTQFRARHLLEEDGIPHMLITPEDGSTKGKGGGKAWIVGIHKHLVELGFVEMVRSIGDGPIFYDDMRGGLPITKQSEMVGRAQEVATKVSEWIKEELGIEPPLGRPNHAWRHFHTTRCRDAGIEKEPRDYMLGSGPGDAREGYGSWSPQTLDGIINKLPRFDVKDTGWRPE